jgi:hypothetical protein
MGGGPACEKYQFNIGGLRNESKLNFAKGLIKRGLFLIESKIEPKVFRCFCAVMIAAR